MPAHVYSKMADADLILDRAIRSNIDLVLHCIDNSTVWKPQTWHHRSPILSDHIPRDGIVPSINHLPWSATCKCQPLAIYLC